MIRVLHVFHEMANGGIEHFVMDYYRHIDRSRVQFDFLVSVESEGYFDQEIQALGGVVHYAYPLKKNPIRNYFDIARIVRENNYDIVHRHTGSAIGYFDLRAARHGGAKHLILHSHNNQAGNQLIHKLSNAFLRLPCEKLACSQEAGEWLFGQQSNFKVISNAIECSKFEFDENTRKSVRSALGISNNFVIGHVGRFEGQKNHSFILKIICEIVKHRPDSIFVLIGAGSLFDETKRMADRLGISQNIMMLGTRADINELMQAFDCFILPSLYEGLPFVLVEAQTSGLHCVVSERVPVECNISGNVEFLNLNDNISIWADHIIACNTQNAKREDFCQIMIDAGFDINKNAAGLCEYYEELSQK